MAAPDLVNLSALIDDAKCSALVRQHRWPEGIRCPACSSGTVVREYLRRSAVEVRFKVPERPSRLDPFADKLSDGQLLAFAKSRKTALLAASGRPRFLLRVT